jgi:hypothetical protein
MKPTLKQVLATVTQIQYLLQLQQADLNSEDGIADQSSSKNTGFETRRF